MVEEDSLSGHTLNALDCSCASGEFYHGAHAFSSIALSLYRDTDPNSVFSLLSHKHSKFYAQLPNP